MSIEKTESNGQRKFCTNCGNEISPEAKFCTECGTPVSHLNESLHEETSNNPRVKFDFKKINLEKFNFKKIDFKIIVAALVMVFVLLIYNITSDKIVGTWDLSMVYLEGDWQVMGDDFWDDSCKFYKNGTGKYTSNAFGVDTDSFEFEWELDYVSSDARYYSVYTGSEYIEVIYYESLNGFTWDDGMFFEK